MVRDVEAIMLSSRLMSPLLRIEIEVFIEIVRQIRRWAEALERHAQNVGDRPIGQSWSDADLTELYEAWLEVGRAIRDVARTRPEPEATEVRPEVLAMRDGLARIASVVERQT